MTESENPLELTYTFSPKETEILAKYIRKNTVPDELGKFRDTIYNAIYSTMTIVEAEKFFKD